MDNDRYPLDSNSTMSAAEIAAAWKRELPGAATDSILAITPLWRVAKILADERRRLLQRLSVEPATLDLLSTLRRAGRPYALTTRELTDRTLVTAGAISQRVARAEHAGLVTRSPTAQSRRGVTVALTTAGHDLIESAVRDLLAHEATLLTALGPSDQHRLGTLLARLEHDLRSR
ncbi:MAG: MarR family winged helix-turn-helix transcriptional regulator [Actinomycetota bacterium]|nr:MarR family winged helix-turn-helix transcriptional regulator [Actinomycetota bacterium]